MNTNNFTPNNYNKINITVPVSTPQSVVTAFRSGTDALYAPLKPDICEPNLFSLSFDQAAALIHHIRSLRKKWYISINSAVQEEYLKKIFTAIEWAHSLDCSGVVISDIGVLRILTKYYPDITVFAGPLFNIHNSHGAKMLADLGVKRITLSHEISLKEIEKIVKAVPDTEIELRVHGQSCFSSYGSCLLSSYTKQKSANINECACPCRIKWNYNDKKIFCFSVFDVNSINMLKNFYDTGVKSITFQGYENKPDYLSKIIHAYRIVIDSIGTPYYEAVLEEAKKIISYATTREQNSGYMAGDTKSITETSFSGGNGKYIGEIKKGGSNRKITFVPYNQSQIKKGDELIMYDPVRESFTEEKINDFRKLSDGNYELIINRHISPESMVYLSTKASWNEQIIQNELNGVFHNYKTKNSGPKVNRSRHDRRKQFKLDMTMYNTGKTEKHSKTELYVKFNNLNWDFILCDERVKYNIFTLNFEFLKLVPEMIKNWPEFNDKIIIELPPLIFEDDIPLYENAVNELIKGKIINFSLNNLSHFSMLKDKNACLFAGSELICLNRQSLYFLNDQKVLQSTFCLESTIVNLRKLVTNQNGSLFCLPVFYVPVLMRSRADISGSIEPDSIISSAKNKFKIINQNKNTLVIPLNPVSITHLLPRIAELNIGAHIIDLSFIEPSQEIWNHIITSYEQYKPIANATQFNFFSNLNRTRLR